MMSFWWGFGLLGIGFVVGWFSGCAAGAGVHTRWLCELAKGMLGKGGCISISMSNWEDDGDDGDDWKEIESDGPPAKEKEFDPDEGETGWTKESTAFTLSELN